MDYQDSRGALIGTASTVGLAQANAKQRVTDANSPREPGALSCLKGAQQVLAAVQDIDSRLAQFAEKLLGGVPQGVNEKDADSIRRHGGAIGEFEGALAAAFHNAQSISDTLRRLEQFI